MRARAQFFAAMFGAGRPSGALGAPGHADSRWRAVRKAVDGARTSANDEAPERVGMLHALRKYLERFADIRH